MTRAGLYRKAAELVEIADDLRWLGNAKRSADYADQGAILLAAASLAERLACALALFANATILP